MTTVIVVQYDIRNGFQGPVVFTTREKALAFIKQDFEGEINDEQLKELDENGYLSLDSYGYKTLAISEETVDP